MHVFVRHSLVSDIPPFYPNMEILQSEGHTLQTSKISSNELVSHMSSVKPVETFWENDQRLEFWAICGPKLQEN